MPCCGYHVGMRLLVVILSAVSVLAVAFAIAWVSTGWPQICVARGWCDPAGAVATSAGHADDRN